MISDRTEKSKYVSSLIQPIDLAMRTFMRVIGFDLSFQPSPLRVHVCVATRPLIYKIKEKTKYVIMLVVDKPCTCLAFEVTFVACVFSR